MIDVEIVKKPRNGTKSSGVVYHSTLTDAKSADMAKAADKAKEADHAVESDHAVEADHAKKATDLDGTALDQLNDKYLRKDKDDTTKHKLTMGEAEVTGEAVIKDRAKSDDFDNHAGFPFGKGWAAIKDDGSESHASMLEVDKLFVRMKAYFAELEIRKISYLGGNYVFSSGGGKIYYIEWLDGKGKILEQTEANKSLVYTFRCYLYSDDGTTRTMNWFQVDDQVRCQNFGDLSKDAKAANGVITATDYTTHYWWRRVNAVGNGVIAAKGDDKAYQYIDFLNTEGQYGADSDFPEVDDAMVQFGNWTTVSRQGVIMIVVTGDDAPAIIEWQDVGANGKHFTMPENEYTRLSPRGDGNIIRGKFLSVSGTTTDNTGKSLDDQINALADHLNDIKNQADKKFDIWFNGGEPHPNSATDKVTNTPASDWTTDAEKALHAQDLYYDTDKNPASKGGRAWRWMAHNSDSTVSYYWDEVTDKDTIDALEKAADLQKQVDDIVSDGVISKGSEKSELLIEWHKAVANYEKYKEQATDYALLDDDVWKKYDHAFFAVGTMLNNGMMHDDGTMLDDGTAYTEENLKDGVTPAWLDMTVDTVLANTPTLNAATYRNTWNDYYTTFAALLKLISSKTKDLADNAQKSADEKVQTFVMETVPDPPYKKGDMWIQTGNGNNVMISLADRESGDTTSSLERLGDWTDLSELSTKQDPRIQLAMLCDKIYELSGGYIQNNGKIAVVFSNKQPSSAANGDLWFDGTNLRRYISSSWSIIDSDTYVRAFKTVFDIVGQQTLTCFSSVQTQNMKLYDLVLRNIKWHDPFKDENVDGNVEVLMYNGKSWETLKECTQAIINNLGDEIRTVVFGSDHKGAVDASGLVTRTMFNKLFSQKVQDGKVVTESTISTWLGDNDYLTGASIKAWAKGDDSGLVKSATLDAYVKKVSNGDGTYSLESDIDISAERINFVGKTIINNKFWVDTDGKVYMEDANISGTINATQGYIAGFKISGSYIGLNQDFGNGTSGMWLSDTEIGFNDYSGDRQAIFGTWNNLGSGQLCRMYDTKNSLLPKLGMSINVNNSVSENTAIALLGGNISGFAMKTLSLGLDSYTNSTTEFNNLKLGEAQKYTLERGVNAVIVHTLFYWREKSTDDYQSKNHDMYITLPDVTDADDGHVIFIKRGKNGSKSPGEIRVYPGKYTQLVTHSSGTYNISYTKEDNMTFINYNAGDFITGVMSNGSIVADYLNVSSDGDAMTFIFFKSLSVTQTINNTKKTFKGCWVQWKNPRDW